MTFIAITYDTVVEGDGSSVVHYTDPQSRHGLPHVLGGALALRRIHLAKITKLKPVVIG